MKTKKHKKHNKLIALRYLPKRLSSKDKQKQSKMLLKSKRLYKKGVFNTRKLLHLFSFQTPIFYKVTK